MKANIKNILVPVDFTPGSLHALECTYSIARFLNAKITLLYVIQPGDFLQEMLRSKDELDSITKEAKRKLEELSKSVVTTTSLNIDVLVKFGKVYEKIMECASEINARFIVLSKHIVHSNEKGILGSNLLRIISQAKTPLIITPGNIESKLEYNKILLPLDLTESSKEMVFNAIAFGIHYNAEIQLVSVLMGGISIWRSRIYGKMRRIKKTIEENGIRCSIKIFKKTDKHLIPSVIINYAQESGSRMIMLMPHHETESNQNYIGAVAYNIINESPIPVMSITPDAGPDNNDVMKPIVDPFGIWK